MQLLSLGAEHRDFWVVSRWADHIAGQFSFFNTLWIDKRELMTKTLTLLC